MTPHPLKDFEAKSSGLKIMDLVKNIGAAAPREEKIDLLPTFASKVHYRSLALDDGRDITMAYQLGSDFPKAVIYHDSFFFSLIPMLSPHFSQVTSFYSRLGV